MRLQNKWICPKCGFPCRTRDELRKHNHIEHADIIKNRPKPYSWECPICHNFFKTSRDRDRHRVDEHGKYCSDKYRHKGSTEWVCKYCLCVCESKRKLAKHYLECDAKRQLPVDSLGRTYDPDIHRKSLATVRQRILDGTLKKKPCSEETRRKLSESRKKQIADGRGSSTWVNPHIHRSYAEQYFYDILVKELNSTVVWRNNYRACGYLLDFANLTNKVYFEVDGESHYTTDGLEYDAKRTAELAKNGWFLIGRIRWKLYKKLSDDERKQIVASYIKAFISNTTNTLPQISVPVNQGAILKNHKTTPRNPERRKVEIEEYASKRKLAEQNGLIRVDGHIDGKGVPNLEWNHRKELILNSGVDLMKFGWVGKVEQVTHLTKRVIEATLTRFPDEFKGKYFRRKLNQFDIKPE